MSLLLLLLIGDGIVVHYDDHDAPVNSYGESSDPHDWRTICQICSLMLTDW